MELFIENMNEVNIEVILRVYCILVNSLSKTTSPKFEKVKLRLKEWINLLKEIFRKFDKNDIHKNYTFIFAHRCKLGSHDRYYEINGEDYLRYHEDEDKRKYKIKTMFLSWAEFDENFKYPKSLFIRLDPDTNEYDTCYESEFEREVNVAYYKLHRKKYLLEKVDKKDPRYRSHYFYNVLKNVLFEEEDLRHEL